MSASIDLEKYNAVAQLLLEAFDDAEISQRDGAGNQSFSYVPPERYRYRLLQVFPNGYTFKVLDVEENKLGVRGTAHFIGEVPEEGVRYDISVPVAEAWTFRSGTKDILNYDQTYSKLASAGIKAVAREMGLGLHLYDKAQKTTGGTKSKPAASKTAAKPAASKSAPATDGDHGDYSQYFDEDWDGSEKLKFTKQKGTEYRELEDGMISWLINKEDQDGKPNPDKGALKEMARRLAEGGDDAQERAESSNAESDDDFPF